MLRNILLSFLGVLLIISTSCTEKVTPEVKTSIGNRPTQQIEIVRGLQWKHTFIVQDPVEGSTYTWQAIYLNHEPDGTFDIDSSGVFSFQSAVSDSGQVFGFRILLGNGSTIIDNYDFDIRVSRDVPFEFTIERTHGTLQGLNEYISVIKIAGTKPIGRFECAIAFDSNYLHYESVEKGTAIGSDQCNWEIITDELTFLSEADSSVASVLYLTATVDDPITEAMPGCSVLPDSAEIFRIKFLTKADHPLICKLIPLRFIWTGCRTNVVYSPSGDSAYLAGSVFDVDMEGDFHDVTDFDCDSSYSYSLGGECGKFLQDCAPAVELSGVTFRNGGVGTACIDSIDIWPPCPWIVPEVNGFFGTSWITIFTAIKGYILCGDDAISGLSPECLRELDTDQDGRLASIADLVYTLRIEQGTALPINRLDPYHSEVSFAVKDDLIISNSNDSLGALEIVVVADSTAEIASRSFLVLEKSYRNGLWHLVLFSGLDNFDNFIKSGVDTLLEISGDFSVAKIETSDYCGNILWSRYNKK